LPKLHEVTPATGYLPKTPAKFHKKKPAFRTTAPAAAPTEAAKILKSAQPYIANNLPDLAKPKLQQIIDTYPTDPAAAKAKDLLAQINQ
jgi:hypothetical protein